MDPLSYFLFVYVLSWMVHIKDPLLSIEKKGHVVAAGFLFSYLRDLLPYVQHHTTVNKNVLSV